MATRAACVLVIGSALLGGCMVNGMGGSSEPRSYAGSECDAVRAASAGDKRTIEHPTPAQRALATACGRIVDWENGEWARRDVLVPALDLRAVHAAFDDRALDAIASAVFVIQAADNELDAHKGYIFVDRGKLEREEADEDEAHNAELVLGIAHLYAAMTRPVLAQQLAALAIPTEAKTVFTQKFEWAASKIDRLIAPMTAGKKKIFVDLPMKVRADRVAAFAEHSSEYANLDALEAEAAQAKVDGDTNAVGAKLTKLRSDFLAKCGGEDCTFDPFYVEATKQLVLLYLAGKQPLLADAEAQVLARKDANRNGFAPQIYAAQMKIVLEAREAFERKTNAKSTGLDAATTKAVMGDVPAMDFETGMFWDVGTSLPDLGGLVESKTVKTDTGAVQSVKTKGATATIEFGTEYDTFGEPYNCVKTGRLEAIHDDGTLQWEENCQYATKKVPRDKPAPITVLASDVKSLRTGEHLTFVVETSTRAAVVVDAFKDEKTLTQLRGDRIGGKTVAGKKKTSAKSAG